MAQGFRQVTLLKYPTFSGRNSKSIIITYYQLVGSTRHLQNMLATCKERWPNAAIPSKENDFLAPPQAEAGCILGCMDQESESTSIVQISPASEKKIMAMMRARLSSLLEPQRKNNHISSKRSSRIQNGLIGHNGLCIQLWPMRKILEA